MSTDSDTLISLIALYRGEPAKNSSNDRAADASTERAGLAAGRSRESQRQTAPRESPPETDLAPLEGEARRTDTPPARRPGAHVSGNDQTSSCVGSGRRQDTLPPRRPGADASENDQPPSGVGTGQRADTPQARKPGPGEVIDAPGVTPGQFTVYQLRDAYHTLDEEITSTLDDPVLKLSENQAIFVPDKSVATGLAKETIRQVNDVRQTLATIPSGWYGVGRKKDIPADAIYVGHFRDTYAWVCRSGCEDLSEFTLAILNLSSLIKDTQVFMVPAGVQFSPALSAHP
jgi:hypothetical protein